MSHRLHISLAVGLIWALLASIAHGQVDLRDLTLLKSAPSLDRAGETMINRFVKQHMDALGDKEPAKVRDARERLVREVRSGMNPAGRAYEVAYTSAINTETVAILDGGANLRAKLNAAIVVARVAEASRAVRLEAAITKLLQNQEEALQLWGMKAAKAVMPELIKANVHQKLFECMRSVIEKHPTGAMTQEAYDAFTRTGDNPQTQVVIDPRLVVEPLLALAQVRLGEWAKGVPNEPAVDRSPFMFLTQKGIWDMILKPVQRTRTMQAIWDGIVLCAYHADSTVGPARGEVAELCRGLTEVLGAAAMVMNEQSLAQKAQQSAQRLRNAAKLLPIIQELAPELKKTRGFESIKDAPPPAAPTTRP